MKTETIDSDLETADSIIRVLQKNNPGLTHSVIAEIADVTPNTVARWASRQLTPEPERIRRLQLLRARQNFPYTTVVPAIVGLWRWPDDQSEGAEGTFFKPEIRALHVSRIESGPRAPGHYWRYTLKLALDFESITFFAFGPDRARIRLHRYRDDDANGSTTVQFNHGDRVPDGKRSKEILLSEDSDIELYVSYRG